MNIQAIPDKQTIKNKFDLLRPFFDERLCRLWAATEARALGRGGASAIAAATGITYRRILVGLRELERREAETTTESSCGLSPHRSHGRAQYRVRRPDAGLTWLRLSYVFSQDGFYTFGDPDVRVTTFADGSIEVIGGVLVTAGGKGQVRATLDFDSNGGLKDVSEDRRVCPGVRPICQATKLLDPDPLVRRMAEQDILVMGTAAKGYLDEQRAKANPELQKAIDRIWKRIMDEEW
jgi:hypothetical protein